MGENELKDRSEGRGYNLRTGKDESNEETDYNENSQDLRSAVSQRITIVGGFLDVALFVADAEHLKFIFDTGKDDINYYELLIGLLLTSLILQILVGILIFIVGFSNNSEKSKEGAKWTKIINYTILGLVAVIAIANILVTVFGDRGEAINLFKTRHNITTKS